MDSSREPELSSQDDMQIAFRVLCNSAKTARTRAQGLEVEVARLEQQLHNADGEKRALLDKVHQLEEALATKDQELAQQLTQQLQRWKQESSRLQQKLNQRGFEILTHQHEATTLKQQLEGAANRAQQAEAAAAAMREKHEKLGQQLASLVSMAGLPGFNGSAGSSVGKLTASDKLEASPRATRTAPDITTTSSHSVLLTPEDSGSLPVTTAQARAEAGSSSSSSSSSMAETFLTPFAFPAAPVFAAAATGRRSSASYRSGSLLMSAEAVVPEGDEAQLLGAASRPGSRSSSTTSQHTPAVSTPTLHSLERSKVVNSDTPSRRHSSSGVRSLLSRLAAHSWTFAQRDRPDAAAAGSASAVLDVATVSPAAQQAHNRLQLLLQQQEQYLQLQQQHQAQQKQMHKQQQQGPPSPRTPPKPAKGGFKERRWLPQVGDSNSQGSSSRSKGASTPLQSRRRLSADTALGMTQLTRAVQPAMSQLGLSPRGGKTPRSLKREEDTRPSSTRAVNM